MSGTPLILLRVAALVVAALVPFASHPPVRAQQGAADEQQSLPLYDLPGDVLGLQKFLATLGHLDKEPANEWNEDVTAALRSFQRARNLPITGALDPATLDALGGPTERARSLPRFRYVIRDGDTLSEVALRFGTSVPWIARFNPGLTSIHRLRPGTEIVVPVRFPLPESLRPERLEVLPDRFLGTYLAEVPFSDVTTLAEQMANTLLEAGFEVERAPTPLDGMTLKGRGIVLGRLVYSAQPSTGRTRVHVALLFSEGGKL